MAINKTLFKVISENIIVSINIFKLFTDYTLKQKKMKVFKVNNMLAVKTIKEDALLLEFKRPTHLIQYFLLIALYYYILQNLKFTKTLLLTCIPILVILFILRCSISTILSGHFSLYFTKPIYQKKLQKKFQKKIR